MGLTWDGNHFWTISYATRKIHRLDVAKHRISHSIPLPKPGPAEFKSLTTSPDGRLWVALWGNMPWDRQELFELDPKDGRVLDSFTFNATYAVKGLQWTERGIWILGMPKGFYRFDPDTHQLVDHATMGQRYSLNFDYGHTMDICSDFAGNLWVAAHQVPTYDYPKQQGFWNGSFLFDLSEYQNDPWVDFDPDRGSIQRDGSAEVTMKIDGSLVQTGQHAFTIQVSSNDHNLPVVSIPVSIDVLPAKGNRPPVAKAGPDLEVRDDDQDGLATDHFERYG